MKSIYRYLHRVTAPNRTGLEWFDLVEIGLVALGFLLYFLVRGAVVDRTREALANARRIVEWQSELGIFLEPAVNAWVLELEFIARLFNWVYFWLDFPLIVAVGLVLFWKRRNCYTLLRDALLISGGFALVLYWTFPVAPPRFFPEWGFVDTLQVYSELAYQSQSTQPFVNPYAAVPSLHVGWSVLLAIVVFWATPNWFLRGLALVILALQSISVVATANHFVFDGIVGVAISLAALVVALWLQRYGYPGMHRWFGERAGVGEPATPSRELAGVAGKR